MHLLVFGLGFCGRAAARCACEAGMNVTATRRNAASAGPDDVQMVSFDEAGPAIASATHLLVTAPPREDGDPVLARYGAAIRTAPHLTWIGYLSTTGVYGDRGGGWVEETTTPAPSAARSVRRLQAELAWRDAAAGRPLDLIRLAGIYGPGRSALDEVRSLRARRVIRPGHAFGRIHVDDIAAGIMAAIASPPEGTRVLNFSDDVPAESALVIEEAARLLGVAPPPAVPFDVAYAGMSEMARSFWAENRRVGNARTKAALGLTWRYPSYKEGLRAVLESEGSPPPRP